MSKYGYLDVFSESPLEFEITRADCIKYHLRARTWKNHVFIPIARVPN